MWLLAGLRLQSDLKQYGARNGDVLQEVCSSSKMEGFPVQSECSFIYHLQFLGSVGPLTCRPDLEEAQHAPRSTKPSFHFQNFTGIAFIYVQTLSQQLL